MIMKYIIYFMKHSQCIQETIKESPEYKSKCVNNLFLAFDKTSTAKSMIEALNIGCCAFNNWQQCISQLVNGKCGSDGSQAVKHLMEKITGGTIDMLCSIEYFDPQNELCTSLPLLNATQSVTNFNESHLNKYLHFLEQSLNNE